VFSSIGGSSKNHMKEKTSAYRFIMDSSPAKTSGQGGVIILRSFKKLLAHEFSFPFHGASKVRDALKLQYKPLLGEGARNVEFIPFFISASKKSSSGCVFIMNKDEADATGETALPANAGCAVWPSPLAFAGEVGPNGLLIWHDENSITTVWIKNWTPALYRTSPSGSVSIEDEERSALEYIESAGGDAPQVLIIDSKDVSDSDLEKCGVHTIASCPAYASLDLSVAGADMRERRERAIGAVTSASRMALAVGAAFLLAVLAIHTAQSSVGVSAALHPAAIYEVSFEERSNQPLISSAAKLRASGETTRSDSIVSLMGDLSSAWGKLGPDPGITIETLRYGAENSDMLGTAKSNEQIQILRRLLEEAGYSLRMDSIQSVPGGDLRFAMNLSRGAGR